MSWDNQAARHGVLGAGSILNTILANQENGTGIEWRHPIRSLYVKYWMKIIFIFVHK